MTCIDSNACCTTLTIPACSLRTAWVAFLTAFLNRDTKKSKKGVTASAIRVKSQLSQNIKASMLTIVSKSTKMFSVDEDANAWMV